MRKLRRPGVAWASTTIEALERRLLLSITPSPTFVESAVARSWTLQLEGDRVISQPVITPLASPVDASSEVVLNDIAPPAPPAQLNLDDETGPPVNLGSFQIVINPGPDLAGNAAALAAFERAADLWEARIADPITVTIDADLLPLGNPFVLGQTAGVFLASDYDTIRDAMVSDAGAEPDDDISASLPTSAQFNATLPDDFTFSGDITAAKANLKALGFTGLDDDFGTTDAIIEFNSEFAFDFDNSDGVESDEIDFETVAAHEIGHALGFISEVDTIDFFDAIEFPGPVDVSPLDLFRFEDTPAGTPGSVADFTNFARSLEPGTESITSDLDNVFAMATGAFTGDGNQASHWKADEITGTTIGIMDPTLDFGVATPISDADFRALDLAGWDIFDQTGPIVSIDDVALLEGDTGFTTFQFTVTLAEELEEELNVDFTTVNGTATAGPDYTATSGTLTFAPGDTLMTIDVDVVGETIIEADETFFVELTPVETGFALAPGIGTILDDDNTPPVAVDDTAVGLQNVPILIDILDNDFDPDAPADSIDPTTVTIVIPPVAGDLIVDPVTGILIYTPGPDFFGSDSLVYTVEDTFGGVSNEAIVSITVQAQPVAVDDAVTTDVNVPIVIDVLDNDFDPDGTLDVSTVVVVDAATSGGTVVNPDGTITYTPNADFAGGDLFTYRVQDNDGLFSNEATVRIRVGAPVTFSGEVYFDTNDNGVRDPGEEPIEGAIVEIEQTSGSLTFVETVLTGPDGSFTLTEADAAFFLPAGMYTIREIQPTILVDGKDKAGTPAPTGPPTNDAFIDIPMDASDAATGYQFGERFLTDEFIDLFLSLPLGVLSTMEFSTVDLGDLLYFEFALSPAAAPALLSFDAGWEGEMDIDLVFEPGSGSAEAILYDREFNVVASANSSSGLLELNHEGEIGEQYALFIDGTTPDLEVQLERILPPAPPNNAPEINTSLTLEATEGDLLSAVLDATDPDGNPLTFLLPFGAPEGLIVDPRSGQIEYMPLDGTDDMVGVPVLVLDGQSSELGDAGVVHIHVANVAPELDVSGPSMAVPGYAATFTLGASDASQADAAAGFTFEIDWDGDGVVDEIVQGPDGTVVSHFFDQLGTYDVGVTAVDKDGGRSTAETQQVEVRAWALIPDPDDPSLTNLVWSGTDGFDVVGFLSTGNPEDVLVFDYFRNGQLANQLEIVSGVTGRVIAHGHGSPDLLAADVLRGIDVELHGGDGQDALFGGDGADTIVGGAGDDLLVGGVLETDSADLLVGDAGRDVLYGHLGGDTLDGGSGEDLLLSGTLDVPDMYDALFDATYEWRSSRSYESRIANLTGEGEGPSKNKDTILVPGVTVLDDEASDTIIGGADLDWFIYTLIADELSDPEADEEQLGL